MKSNCMQGDALPGVESLQRAICMAYKLTGIWCDRWHTARSNRVGAGISYKAEEDFARPLKATRIGLQIP